MFNHVMCYIFVTLNVTAKMVRHAKRCKSKKFKACQ